MSAALARVGRTLRAAWIPILVWLLLDEGTKIASRLLLPEGIPPDIGLLGFVRAENHAAMTGFGAGVFSAWVIGLLGSLLLPAAALIASMRLGPPTTRLGLIGLGGIIGGGIGNTADRLLRGYVIDFFSINIRGDLLLIINLADIGIVFGALWVCLALVADLRRRARTRAALPQPA